MLVVRWVLLLFLSVAAGVIGAVPLGQAEAVEEGEEALHGARLRRPVAVQTRQARDTQAQRLRAGVMALPALRAARLADRAPARPAVRKLPSPGPEPGPPVDDH